MYAGKIVEKGTADDVFNHMRHPYTEGLLKSLPKRGTNERLHVIPGSVPSPGHLPQGCVFNPRCPYATDKCRTEDPSYMQMGSGHCVKCWRYTGEVQHG